MTYRLSEFMCGRRRIAALIAGVALAAGLLPGLAGGAHVAAQAPPPAERVVVTISHDFTDTPRQYDLFQVLAEFQPGASTPWHRVNGRGIFTVLSGEITRVEEDGEREVFKAGETFTEEFDDHVDYDANLGSTPARLLLTVLLSPGAEPLLVHPSLPFPGTSAPRFVAMARTTVGTIPAEFTLTQGLVEFPPGYEVGPHRHDEWNMITELSGGHVTNIVNGVAQTRATFVHGPHDRHEGRHTGPETVTAMFASVGPAGAPPSRPVTPGAAPAIRPPATGDAGLAARH